MKNLNISSLVASIEAEGTSPMQAPRSQLGEKLAARAEATRANEPELSKVASEAEDMAAILANSIGLDTMSIASQLQKTASDMSEAESLEEIVKIASDLGNTDLANISTIANKITDVVCAQIESRTSGEH